MKRFLPVLLLAVIFLPVKAQSDSLEVQPLQVSFFYPFGTAGTHSIHYGYNFSFNILTGITGAAHGVEIGGITNINRQYNNGFQLAGISNISGSYNYGGQVAGICNIIGGYSKGAQVSGIGNLTGGWVNGLQAAGIFNMSGDSVIGAQLGGIFNEAGSIKGLQAAGIMNVSGNTEGCQIGGIINVSDDANAQLAGIGNIADSVNGVQIGGIFNVAGYVKGVQLAGIINICDSIDGIPLAMISIVGKNGYRRWDVWGSEAFYFNVSYKIGIRQLYSIFSLGYKTGNLDNNMGFGWGLGTNVPFTEKSSIDVEAHMYQINRYFWMNEDNFMYTLRVNYVQHLGKRMAIFAGPAFNMLSTDYLSDAYNIAPGYGVEYKSSNTWQYWVGIQAGIRL